MFLCMLSQAYNNAQTVTWECHSIYRWKSGTNLQYQFHNSYAGDQRIWFVRNICTGCSSIHKLYTLSKAVQEGDAKFGKMHINCKNISTSHVGW